jgi:hypothetical protein
MSVIRNINIRPNLFTCIQYKWFALRCRLISTHTAAITGHNHTPYEPIRHAATSFISTSTIKVYYICLHKFKISASRSHPAQIRSTHTPPTRAMRLVWSHSLTHSLTSPAGSLASKLASLGIECSVDSPHVVQRPHASVLPPLPSRGGGGGGGGGGVRAGHEEVVGDRGPRQGEVALH